MEHPELSYAFEEFGLGKPPKSGGWVPACSVPGYICHVEQGHYGHRARKATWLYAHGVKLPEIIWGKAEGKIRLDQGHHSRAERIARGEQHRRITARECLSTPPAFAELLLSAARTAAPTPAGEP